MADRKTATLMLRIQPTLKQDLRALAARERRSLSNMIEVMILDYGRRHGPEILEDPPAAGFVHPAGRSMQQVPHVRPPRQPLP